jgi:hypothetical protein
LIGPLKSLASSIQSGNYFLAEYSFGFRIYSQVKVIQGNEEGKPDDKTFLTMEDFEVKSEFKPGLVKVFSFVHKLAFAIYLGQFNE